MKKLFLTAFFLFLSIALLFSEAAGAEEMSDLYKTTMKTDIATSGFHELTDWCNRLGLPEDGSADELRNRLYQYYGLSRDSSSVEEEKSTGRQIYIEKAENLNYFTIEKVDENYAKISGDVYLKLFDKEKNETHIIQADTIIFNFKENYLTATGDIRYSLEGETKTENFKGEKLTFNIDNTAGLFDKGVTEQEKTVEEEDIVFYFKGDLINKTRENYVMLENGQITSCDFDDPHFTIKARKIWLLTSDEWAILNGIVYIGRVPLMYLPAFLYGEDDMIFNPVFGYRNDFGNYLQTTTYFIGEKEKDEESTFSFMQSDSEDKYYKREGLYLTEDKNPGKQEKAIQDYGRESKNYAKLLLDYYTNLGIYTAFDLKMSTPSANEEAAFPDIINSLLSVFKSTDLYISVARTRYTENTGNFYSALFPDDEGRYRSIWMNSFFVQEPVPFRYGFDFSSVFDIDWLKLNTDLALYSDPSYTKDFTDRSENLDLLSFMDQGTNTETTGTGTETSSYEWTAVLNLNPDLGILNPWINQFSLNAESALGWKSKSLVDTENEYENTIEYFFYPDNLEQVTTSMSLGGQLLPFSFKRNTSEEKETDGNKLTLRPPWEESEKNTIPEIREEGLPDAAPDIEIDITNYWTDKQAFNQKLNYKMSPKYTNRSQLNTSDWETPDDIDVADIDYSYRTASIDGKLTYSANIFNSLLALNNIVAAEWDYKQHFDMESLDEDTVQNYLDEDNQGTDTKVTNNLTISTMPLVFMDFLEDVKLTYNFNSLVYEWDYSTEDEAFSASYFDLTEDYITGHKLSLELPFDIRNLNQTLKLATTLPPVSLSASGSLVLKYGFSTTSFATDLTEKDEEIEYSPLTFSEKLNFGNGNSFTNDISYNYTELKFEKNISALSLAFFDKDIMAGASMTYDFTENTIETLSGNLDLWFLSTDFTAKNTYDYTFDTETGWVQAEEQSFIPFSLLFSVKHESEDLVFWKNRIGLKYDIDSGVNFKLIQFTETAFTLKLGLDLSIYEFLDFTFDVVSANNSIYRYIPEYCEQTGVNSINFFDDLVKSFNFFKIEDRYASNFNLQSMNIGLVHDLHDWDLKITYSGKPFINDEGDYPKYEWENTLDISLVWKAIPDIKSEIEIDEEGVSF